MAFVRRFANALILKRDANSLSSHDHPVVKAFLTKVHCADYFHEGVEYLKSIIQQKFWILGLRSELRRIKIKCVLCRKRQPLTIQPQMADLPSDRLAFKRFLLLLLVLTCSVRLKLK